MPRPLPPEQQEALEARGVVIPGPQHEALPAETVARVLGSVGLPHSERVERLGSGMGVDGNSDIAFDGTFESIGSLPLKESYTANFSAVSKIMLLMGETRPHILDRELLTQLESLEPAFEVFERYDLAPEVVLTPIHNELTFWEDLFEAVRASSLNPDQLDPEKPTQNRKVLRNNSLWVGNKVKDEWNNLTNPTNSPASWQLSVASGLEQPKITNVTSHGFTDSENTNLSTALNLLLNALGQRLVPNRSNNLSPPLTQPTIHPTPEAYLMHQLTRIVQNKEPLDSATQSWLNGTLAGGLVPVGIWNPNDGWVALDYEYSDNFCGILGVRPSVRVNYA